MSAKGQKRTITAPIEFVRFVPETPHTSIVWTSIGATVNYPQQYRPSRRAERCLHHHRTAAISRAPLGAGGRAHGLLVPLMLKHSRSQPDNIFPTEDGLFFFGWHMSRITHKPIAVAAGLGHWASIAR
jgi:hypothetical protein